MSDDKEWGICPHCDAKIKYKNMSHHLKKVHQVYDTSSKKQRVVSRKKGGASNKRRGDPKKSSTDTEALRKSIAKQKRQVKGMMIMGVIVVVLLVSSVAYWLLFLETSSEDGEDVHEDGDEDVLDDVEVDPNIGAMAALFNGTDTEGAPFDLDDHLGIRPILVEFFSSTCGKCKYIASLLIEISDAYGDDIAIISVSLSRMDSMESVIEFKSSYESNWTYVIPSQSEKEHIGDNYTIGGYPTITFIDSDGTIDDTIYSKSILEEYDADLKTISDGVEKILEGVERTPDEIVGSSVGNRAPQFNITDTHGNHFDLFSEIGEKPILLEFFYTKCGHCNDLADVLNDIYREYGDRITLVSIATSSMDDINTVKEFQDNHKSVWAHLAGDKSDGFNIQLDYDHGTFPSMVLVDTNGIIFQWLREDDLDDHDMEFNHGLIADALNNVLKA